MIRSQKDVQWRQGKSSFNHPDVALRGDIMEIKTGTVLPEGLAVKADGIEVGGPMSRGQNTFYATEDMSMDDFNKKIDEIPKTKCR
jgi:hypothetical protein